MSIHDNKEVIAIQEMIINCQESIDEKEKRLSGYNLKLAILLHNLNTTNEDIRKAVTTRVSDHAVLRYLERHYKMDIGKIKSEIMTPVVEAAIRAGATSVKVNGISFVLRDGTIVTSLIEKDIVNRRSKSAKKFSLMTDKKRRKK